MASGPNASRRLGGAIVHALLLAAAVPAAAQQVEPILSEIAPDAGREAWQAHPADSARVLSRARSAQSRYELIRRNHLPWTWDRGGAPCDERIGRFCLWYGDGDSGWKPPPDPEPIVAAREELVARLDTAAAVIPGDWWVAGHRVRYLVEADRTTEAVAAARACRSREPGWCRALLGFALHSDRDYVAADSAFAAALAEMPPARRRRWTDLSPLLEPGAVRAYRRLDDADRAAFEARYWWLADPLFMVPGNDRRTAHFSRHVLDRLQDRARQTEGISWGSDLREILLRFGPPAGWERIRPRAPHQEGTSVLTRYPSGSRHFDPPPRFVDDPFSIAAEEWEIDGRGSRTSFAPAYAAPIEELEYQLATFRRGDSALVAVAMRLPEDSTGTRHDADAAVFAWHDLDGDPLVVHGRVGAAPAAFTLRLPGAPALLSLEAHAAEANRAARVRFAVPLAPLPPHGLAVSDLLLVDAVDPLPESCEAALPHARAGRELRSGDRLGLCWELYGLGRADLPVRVDVRLVDDNTGWLRRAAMRMGIARERSPLTVRWQEAPGEPGPVYSRTATIEFPELSPGEYTLQLTLTPRGREALQTARQIRIVD